MLGSTADSARNNEADISGRSRVLRNAILTCTLGYLLIVISTLVLMVIVRIVTGYYQSPVYFGLALMTFRLSEISGIFAVAPLLVSLPVMIALSGIPVHKWILGGISSSEYYLLVALIFASIGAHEFPYEVLLPWMALVFLLGSLSAIVVGKLARG